MEQFQWGSEDQAVFILFTLLACYRSISWTKLDVMGGQFVTCLDHSPADHNRASKKELH